MELFSIQNEQSVIGALLVWPDSYDSVHWLKPSRFYDYGNREIFTTISTMMSESKAVDPITVADELERVGKLKSVGGIVYLDQLATSVSSAVNIRRYAEVVHERGMARDMMSAVNGIIDDLQNPGNIADKLNRAQASVMAITEQAQTSEPQFVGDLLLERIERVEQASEGKIKLIGTGLTDLDSAIGGGFQPGDLVIVAARPSMGKTALAVQICQEMQTPDAAALVFSCEMANGQIVDRMIAGAARVSSEKLRAGSLDTEDWDRLPYAIGKLKSLNMLIDDKAFTLNAIMAKARTIKRKYGLSAVMVDYIQLLEGVGDSREQQVAGISRGLKKLAKELDVPVIALSQLSRKVEERADKRPVMSDLRESGSIEQDADVIAFIYRDEYYNPDSPYKGTAEVIIGKHRNGRVGRVHLHFDGEHTRFGNHSGQFENVVPMQKKRRGFGDE